MKRYSVLHAQDAYAEMFRLYGDRSTAQTLMRVRGAADAWVARLAVAMMSWPQAVEAARVYDRLGSLPWGFGRLMAAVGTDGRVKAVIKRAMGSRRFSAWEIDTAVKVVLALS